MTHEAPAKPARLKPPPYGHRTASTADTRELTVTGPPPALGHCTQIDAATAQPGSTEQIGLWAASQRADALLCKENRSCLGTSRRAQEGIQQVRVSHAISPVFDDPNLVSCTGLAPVVALAERCGLHELVANTLTLSGEGSAYAEVKIPALVAGMIAGADSIDDMDLLRHGGMGRLFDQVRAPSTLGTFLRTFTFGHVRQLDAIAARLLVDLAAHTPLLPDADQVCFIDIDDTVKQTYGYTKQGAGYGYSGVKGLNALIAVVSTPTSAPVIAATRLRKGKVNSARGAARLVTDALKVTQNIRKQSASKGHGKSHGKDAGSGPGSGLVLVRMDSAFYTADVVAAARRSGAKVSITARMNKAVTAAITGIEETAWTPIKYPHAIWDDDEQRWISDAEVAEVDYTAFTSRTKAMHATGRLIVRRVRRLNPGADPQGELFAAYRYHAVFTDSSLELLQAESYHRGHAVIEQVHADLKSGPLAHLPSASFAANSAWLVLAAMAFNLTRAAGALASMFHARATTATIRTQLISVPGRIASSARRQTLHLPRDWPWEQAWQNMAAGALGPPHSRAA